MTNYGQLYNERVTKNAPRYSQGAQARTYMDYMQNIQAQKQAAGQTFGNLYQQQANQSFYDRASGTPPGLSGGMQQQYSAARSAQSNAALGQVAQQRYQAFADIAAQEAQASQFEQAQRLQQQQVQMGELQLNQQRYAQAEQIMASTTLTPEQKNTQLTNLGLTEGEISDMNSTNPVGGIVGGGTTLAASLGVGYLTTDKFAQRQVAKLENVQVLNDFVRGEAETATQAVNQSIETLNNDIDQLLVDPADATKKIDPKDLSGNKKIEYDKKLGEVRAKQQELKQVEEKLRNDLTTDPKKATAEQRTLQQKARESLAAPDEVAEVANKKAAEQAQTAAETAKRTADGALVDTQKEIAELKSKKSLTSQENARLKKLNKKLPDLKKAAKGAADKVDDAAKAVKGATTKGTKAVERKLSKTAKLLKKVKPGTAAIDKKALAGAGLKKLAGGLTGILSVYFIVDSISTIATGKGIIGNLTAVAKGEEIGKGGLAGLF